MTIQNAIESAIRGGWAPFDKVEAHRGYTLEAMLYKNTVYRIRAASGSMSQVPVEVALLSPDFWRALGKSEGWDDEQTKYRWLNMSVQIWDGKSIEEYFGTL